MKKPMMVMMVLILVSLFYAAQGFIMHNQVQGEEDAFHALQADYLNIDKATRDSAAANSELTTQLGEVANYPSTLLQLKLVGIGRILIGIYIALLGILMALIMMPMRLGMILHKKK